MRGRGWAVGLAVVAWSAVLVGGAAAPAAAVEPPAPPLGDARFDWDAARAQMAERKPAARVPGTVLRSGWTSGGAGTQMRVALARRSVEQTAAKGAVTVASTVGGSASKFGMVLKGAGTALTAAFALDLTYTAFTGGYGDGFGFGGLIGYESDGLLCDLSTLVLSTVDCSVAIAPGFNPDGDYVLVDPAGWAPLQTLTLPVYGNAVAFNATDSGWRNSNAPNTVAWNIGGVRPATGPAAAWIDLEYFRVDAAGTVIAAGSQENRIRNDWPAQGSWSNTTWAPSGFDHWTVQLRVEGSPAQVSPKTYYYPVGHLSRPETGPASPTRWLTTEWLCEAGGVTTSHTADSAPFSELDGEFPEAVQPVCDPGALTSVTVTEYSSDTDPATLYEWTLPAEMRAWAATYPQCVDGSCTLELLRIDPATANRLACFDNPELCLGWFEDPLKADNYLCTYGGQDVALAECNLYAPTFDPSRWPVSGKAPYADPETGEIPTDAPVALPEQETGCPPPFSWSAVWNNWWLFKAVDCGVRSAGTALFVPVTLPGKMDALTAMAQTRTPYPELASMAAALAPPEGGSVCMVLSLPLTFVLGHDQPFLDSCTWADPVSQFLRDYRVLFAAAVWISVISPLAWWAWRQYAPGASGVA